MSSFWVVCYDVRDDKRRQKLAKRIEQRCQRVQYSVFECPVTEAELMELLQQRWLPLLKLAEDSLRVYPLDGKAKQQARVYGSPPLYEPPDYLIL
ncbi:CRISPR-associated endonuclease Cas2 [Pantanalinema rosaneae CENA516]|uniref:CRISPR-associated endonuclease Cas2 n=1 Tax=Pantanalinema rosaneae TaxID=1620701 RepID=UPI003D6E980D